MYEVGTLSQGDFDKQKGIILEQMGLRSLDSSLSRTWCSLLQLLLSLYSSILLDHMHGYSMFLLHHCACFLIT